MKGPSRKDVRDSIEVLGYEEELRMNPPILEWALVPNSGGLRIAIYVFDPPPGVPGRRLNPPCACNLFGSPRRKKGNHHEERCGRWAA